MPDTFPSPEVAFQWRRLHQQLKRARYRSPLLLEGRAEWQHDWMHWLLQDSPWSAAALELPSAATVTQARRWLGRTLDLAVLWGREPPSPDVLAILAGTLGAGGLLVLAPDDMSPWTATFDARLRDAWCRDARVISVQEPGDLSAYENWPPKQLLGVDALGCLTQDQALAVAQVQRVVRGHRRRPLVLRADRGRGKSSALGLAAAALMHQDGLKQGSRRILVTAPRLEAVEEIFARAHERLGGAQWQAGRLASGDSELIYRAPDALVESSEAADLVMVDEAAALPAPMLLALVRSQARLVMATTTRGYEGSGRGFDVRFLPLLAQEAPGWRMLELQEPVRWSSGDPLESWIRDLCLFDAEPSEFTAVDAHKLSAGDAEGSIWRWLRLTGDELAARPDLLEPFFALLVNAHYRTRPSDLRDILQAPGMAIRLALMEDRVAAGLLTLDEGALDEPLATEVWLGRRRPPGALIPQTLVGQCGWLDAVGLNFVRVLRIAVHPRLQRSGLGQSLLQERARELRQQGGCDLLGVSFAATSELPRFWAAAGFQPLRLGFRRNAASGSHSLLMGQALTQAGQKLLDQHQHEFHDYLMAQASGAYAQFEPELLASLLRLCPETSPLAPVQDSLDILAYTAGCRPYAQCEPALRRFLVERLAAGDPVREEDLKPLVARILQRRSVAETVALYGLGGRRALDKALRRSLAPLVARELLPQAPEHLKPELETLLEKLL